MASWKVVDLAVWMECKEMDRWMEGGSECGWEVEKWMDGRMSEEWVWMKSKDMDGRSGVDR